jgi:hypothetical protein
VVPGRGRPRELELMGPVRPLPDLDAALRDPDGRELLEALAGLTGWGRCSIDEILAHLAAWFRFWTAGSGRTVEMVEALARETATFPPGFADPDAAQALRDWRTREFQHAVRLAEDRLAVFCAISPTVDARAAAREDVAATFSSLVADALVDVWSRAAEPQPVTVEEAGHRHRRLYVPASVPLPDLFRWVRTRVMELAGERLIVQMAEVSPARVAVELAVVDLYGRPLAPGDPDDEPSTAPMSTAQLDRVPVTPTQRAVLVALRAAIQEGTDPKHALHLLTQRRGWAPSTVRSHMQNIRRKLGHLHRAPRPT